MNWQFLRVTLVVAVWSSFLALMIYALDIGKISPIEGTTLITAGQQCESPRCERPKSAQLPYFGAYEFKAGQTAETFLFAFEFDGDTEGIHAIYLPKVKHDVRLMVNGNVVRTADSKGRRWNRPILTAIPQSVLRIGQNNLLIEVVSMAQEGVELQPVYFGPRLLLQAPYQLRYFATVFVAQFSAGLMVILAIVFLAILIFSHQERLYFYLFCSCVSAALLSLQFAVSTSGISYKYWAIIWMYATPVYVLTLAMFIRHSIGLKINFIERIVAVLIALVVLIALFLPERFIYRYGLVTNLGTGVGAVLLTAWFWTHRHKFDRPDFVVMFISMSMAMGFGFYVLFLLLWPEPARNQHLYAFMPFTMVGMSLWLIISRLIRALADYRALNEAQEVTIADKTAKLEESYKKLAEIQRREAVHGERQRIMLDLHDGVGGQLTNVLAYMENNNAGDDVLRTALEDALRDLGLMLDSMESEDSVATLLGMLRSRLEPLVTEYGLQFNWQIDADLQLPHPSPSHNLNLLRLVQEAITNAIKHANAKTITVVSRKQSISVTDDGQGFDVDEKRKDGRGYGLLNMQRRAKQLGAQMTLSSDDSGTLMHLSWADTQ